MEAPPPSRAPRPLPMPGGISTAEAGRALGLTAGQICRLIRAGFIVAWRPFPHSRSWRVDEISLARYQHTRILAARAAAEPLQQLLLDL